jgi:hypothetical protein
MDRSTGYASNSNTIVEQDTLVEEISPAHENQTAQYCHQVEKTDPLAEMFKTHANESNIESSFYSTPLNHTIPNKYNPDPNQSPSKMALGSVESINDDGFTPITYASIDKKDIREASMAHRHDMMVSSSSTSSSPGKRSSPEDDSQALVTASEG